MSQLYKLLGKRIAYFRRKAGLTQEQLAEKLDYSVDFISKVERGINAPTIQRLGDLAEILGVHVWQLFLVATRDESTQTDSQISKGKPKTSAGE